jgi:PKD repeat protein
MAESEPVAKKGWLKTVLGTVGGLVSGAVVMYATAAFNEVVKPSKPVANFKYDATGTTVQFHNLSGASQGWWDFGDGSALEPVAGRDSVTHTYSRVADYTVKLSLQNILGEETERSVTVHLDAPGAGAAGPPQVAALEAVPVSPGSYAPATFKLVSKVQNAQLCLLDYGDERAPEVLSGAAASERLVTGVVVATPGGQQIAMAAGQATLDMDATALGIKGGRNLRLQLVNGGKAVRFSGEPGKTSKGQPLPARISLVVTEQRRQPAGQSGVTSSTTLALPVGRQPSKADVALPSVPADWVDITRLARLKLSDGDKVLWEGAVPGSASVVIGKRAYQLTATASDGQVHLDLRDPASGAAPAAN